MLTSDLIDKLLEPVSEDAPSGPDLEYDTAFMQLTVAAEGKSEQQFGDTIIAAVEPEWNQVEQQALALLERSKDLRTAILLLRAVTHTQGLEGAAAGLQLLCGLLEAFWDSVHPQLDADDDNDPTMRLNALAALGDGSTVVRDLYSASLGTAPGVGPIRVHDLAVARGVLAAPEGGGGLSAAAVQGGLDDILPSAPQTVAAMRSLSNLLQRITDVVSQHCDAPPPDLERPLAIARLLQDAAPEDVAAEPAAAPEEVAAVSPQETAAAPAAAGSTAPGEIRSRQDVLKTLDRVIHYLQQTEPGNPAPLLLRRAKQLIGVSFMDIMSNLAPDALDAIERIAGQQSESADSAESDDSSES